jgi:tetratricopeptide (TPR) repeat protein
MPAVELALAAVDMNRRRYKEALERLGALEQAEATTPGLYLRIGEANNRLRRWAEAEKAFGKAIELDGDNAAAYQGLAVACIGLKRHEEAVGHALKAVELVHHAPMSHYQLGVGLIRIGRHEDAERALKVCLSQAPGMLMAHRRLAMIYHKHMNQPEKAREHRGLARKIYHERVGRRAGRKMKRV